MPLQQIRKLDNYTLLGIWELTEQPDKLMPQLPPYITPDKSIQEAHPRRQREWLCSRVLAYRLLQNFTKLPLELLRDENKKPYFAGHQLHISITHSPQLAAVILSEKANVGIDIELITPKALRVADKFLAKAELGYTAGDEEKTCLYWSAKETLYKMYSRRQLTLKENLLLQPTENPTILLGRVQIDAYKRIFHVHHEKVKDHILTYSIDNPSINKDKP